MDGAPPTSVAPTHASAEDAPRLVTSQAPLPPWPVARKQSPAPLPRDVPAAAVAVAGAVAARRLLGQDLRNSVVYVGVVEAALPPAAQDGWRWRVRFGDGSAQVVAWPELHAWLMNDDDGDDAAAGDSCQAAQAPAAAPAPPPVAAPPPAAPAEQGAAGGSHKQYKGVSADLGDPSLFRTETRVGGQRVTHNGFATAAEAAHVYDEGRRRRGLRVVNFPREGTNEVQAVPYETDLFTLQRLEPGVDHVRPPRAPRADATTAEAAPKVLLRSCAATAVDTPVAAPPAPAAAAPSPPPEDADPLVGCRVRLPFGKSRGVKTTIYAGTVAAQRGRGTRYVVKLDTGGKCAITKADALKFSAAQAAAGGDAAGAAAGSHSLPQVKGACMQRGEQASKRSRQGGAAAAAPPPRKRKRPAEPPASDSDDAAAAVPSEPGEQPPSAAGAHPAACAAPAGAPAAAVASPATRAAPALSDGADAMAAFLRGITPPLQDLAAILGELPATGFTIAHVALLTLHRMGKPVFEQLRDDTCKALKITRPADQLAFTAALTTLQQQRAT